jgi:citrate synthase
MAATCGVGINNAMASAINALGDVHGGAGQQAMEIYCAIEGRIRSGQSLAQAVEDKVAERLRDGKMIEGFGHRFHRIDPRAVRLLELLDGAAGQGAIEGRFKEIARAVEAELEKIKGMRLAMNIDGATAAVFTELGFGPEDARGLFVLSRSVGILAHAREQSLQGGRIKGPMPPSIPYRFEGTAPRSFSAKEPKPGQGGAQ